MNRHRRTCRRTDHRRRPRITMYDAHWQPCATYAQQHDGTWLLVAQGRPAEVGHGDRWARITISAGEPILVGGEIDAWRIHSDPLTDLAAGTFTL